MVCPLDPGNGASLGGLAQALGFAGKPIGIAAARRVVFVEAGFDRGRAKGEVWIQPKLECAIESNVEMGGFEEIVWFGTALTRFGDVEAPVVSGGHKIHAGAEFEIRDPGFFGGLGSAVQTVSAWHDRHDPRSAKVPSLPSNSVICRM